MNAGELIALLQKVDSSLHVSIDGCDCADSASAVFVSAGLVSIARSDTENHYEEDERVV